MRISHCDLCWKTYITIPVHIRVYETESAYHPLDTWNEWSQHASFKLSRRMFSRKIRSLGLKLVPYISAESCQAYTEWFFFCLSFFFCWKKLCRRTFGLAFRGKLRKSTSLINCQDICNWCIAHPGSFIYFSPSNSLSLVPDRMRNKCCKYRTLLEKTISLYHLFINCILNLF